MSQGFTRKLPFPTVISTYYADAPVLDSFQRLRVGSPTYVFDAQLTYDLQPLLYEQITNGSGATVTHDSTNRMALMTFSNTPTGGKSYMQSFEHFRYQPGRSQQIFMTFNFVETKANTLKFVGYSTGTNGIELQQSGSTVQLVNYSATTAGNETVAQASWNIDPMNGSGPSGITLDLTRTQILVIDFQALYTGRVRVGFDVGGLIYYVHQFNHSNLIAYPYLQSANLPVRCGMTCTGTVSTTMNFICCSVSSNGGQEDIGGYTQCVEGTGTAGSSAFAHLLSVRPKTTFNSITNRVKFVLESAEYCNTGNNPVIVAVVIGQAISGTTTFADVNATYSAFEFNTAGAISGTAATTIFQSYAAAASGLTKFTASYKLATKYPVSLDAAGAVRALGTISVIAYGIGGTSAGRVTLNWKEIR